MVGEILTTKQAKECQLCDSKVGTPPGHVTGTYGEILPQNGTSEHGPKQSGCNAH